MGILTLAGNIVVLCYHDFNSSSPYSVSVENFVRHIKFVRKSGVPFLSGSELLKIYKNGTVPYRKGVVVCIDDGWVSFYKYIFPIILKYRIPVVLSIYPSVIGKKEFVTWKMLREMLKSGLVEIASHSMTHPDLTLLSSQQLYYELALSKALLEEKLGIEINFFTYPYGMFDENVVRAVEECGYERAFTSCPGFNDSSTNPFLIRRFVIFSSTKLRDIKTILYSEPMEVVFPVSDGQFYSEAFLPVFLPERTEVYINGRRILTAQGLLNVKLLNHRYNHIVFKRADSVASILLFPRGARF